jgi:hypothetical protein
MLLVTLVTVILSALVLVGLVVSGPAAKSVGNAIGLGSTAVLVWRIAKWPVIAHEGQDCDHSGPATRADGSLTRCCSLGPAHKSTVSESVPGR